MATRRVEGAPSRSRTRTRTESLARSSFEGRSSSREPGRPLTSYERIYRVVRRIPRGRVASYGQVARAAGLPGHARQVGYALHALTPNSGVPWQRVLNAKGEISLRSPDGGGGLQRALLEHEGIVFDRAGRVDLKRFGWRTGSP